MCITCINLSIQVCEEVAEEEEGDVEAEEGGGAVGEDRQLLIVFYSRCDRKENGCIREQKVFFIVREWLYT